MQRIIAIFLLLSVSLFGQGYYASRSGLGSRTTVVKTTASLANAATETGTVTMGKSFFLLKVQTSCAARVELYSTAAARTADAARAAGTPPTAGTQHGVIADVQNGTAQTWLMSPAAVGFSGDSPATTSIYYRVTNNDTTQAVTVTFTYLVLEL